MQAQVKDEPQEAQPLDGASQKSVTDWLMHVISGKQPSAEDRLRGVTQETVQPDPIFQLDPPVTPKEMNGHGNGNGATPEAWTGAFTAEDLCGAPLIPMPVVVKEAPGEDAITADDVCWVPEERRLKPQPVMMETPHQEQMASVVDITRDITREPAPHYVRETSAPTLVTPEKEITAADISRQWVIDEMEQASAAVAPAPEPELYVPQFVSTPVQEEIERPAEPIAAVATQEQPVIAPEPVAAPEPVVTPESMLVAEPEATPEFVVVPEPAAIFTENVMEAGPEPTPAMESAVIDLAVEPEIEPEIQAAEIETAQAEPVAMAEPETVVSEVAVEPAHGMAGQDFEVPEIAGESAVDVDSEEKTGVAEPAGFAEPAGIAEPAGVAEPDKYAGVKVWAKGGYWEGSHPAADGTEPSIVQEKTAEDKIVEGKIEKGPEKGLGTAQQNAARGYFGSYLGPEELEEIEKAKPEGWSQSWRTLIRLGSALPWLSRALPALEAGMGNHPGAAAGAGIDPAPGVNSEVQQDVAGMRLVQYEIRTTVQDHSAQLKRVEEQLARVRDSVEAKAANRELAEDVQSAMKMLKIVGIGLGGLLVVLIVLALVMVVKH